MQVIHEAGPAAFQGMLVGQPHCLHLVQGHPGSALQCCNARQVFQRWAQLPCIAALWS